MCGLRRVHRGIAPYRSTYSPCSTNASAWRVTEGCCLESTLFSAVHGCIIYSFVRMYIAMPGRCGKRESRVYIASSTGMH